MLLYVWLASWEIECCQPELTVGDTWGGSFYLGDAEPWWSQQLFHGRLDFSAHGGGEPGTELDDLIDLEIP